MSIADRQKHQRQKTRRDSRLPDNEGGATRRGFLCAATGTGTALALGFPSSARASDGRRGSVPAIELNDVEWEWVGPDEEYDRRCEYMFVYENGIPDWEPVLLDEPEDPAFEYEYQSEDGIPVVWEDVGQEEPDDPAYDYVWAHEYQDGTPVPFMPVNPEDPFNYAYEYVNQDGSEIEWEEVDPGEFRDEHYHYVDVYEFVYEDGTPSMWEWVGLRELYSSYYDYAYEFNR